MDGHANKQPYRNADKINSHMFQNGVSSNAHMDLTKLGVRFKRGAPGDDAADIIANVRETEHLSIEDGDLLFTEKIPQSTLSNRGSLESASVFSAFNNFILDDEYMKAPEYEKANFFYDKFHFIGISISSKRFDQQNIQSAARNKPGVGFNASGTFTTLALLHDIAPGTDLQWNVVSPKQLTEGRYKKYYGGKQLGYWEPYNHHMFKHCVDGMMKQFKTDGALKPPLSKQLEAYVLLYINTVKDVLQVVDPVAYGSGPVTNVTIMTNALRNVLRTMDHTNMKSFIMSTHDKTYDHMARKRARSVTGAKKGDTYTAMLL